MQTFDLIVLGTGGVGSAALYLAAKRGLRCLGVDAFPPAHALGSSHGQTRIIRQAYYEHPVYVPLAIASYDHWRALEQESGEQVFVQTGLLQVGPSQGEVLRGVRESARRYNLAVEELSRVEIAQRFPGFRVPPGMDGIYEATAGYLRVERAIALHLTLAQQHGVMLHTGQRVVRWNVENGADGSVAIETADGLRFEAARLIITAGAWAAQLLPELGRTLTVLRKPQFWFPVTEPRLRPADSPAFLYEMPEGVFYGFPPIDGRMKVAEHSGGLPVADPLSVERAIQPMDLPPLQRFIAAQLPGLDATPVDHSVCMYTMSPDAHFVVDRHPLYPQVAFAAGLSGHGFKFTGVLGQALVELAVDGTTDLSIQFLSASRLA